MTTVPDFLETVSTYKSYLGHGSFGFVLLAEHNDKTSSAIKFIYPTDDAKKNVQHQREATLTKPLRRHENLVTVKNSVFQKTLNPSQLNDIFSHCSHTTEATWKDLPTKIQNLGWTCIQMAPCGKNLSRWLDDPDSNITSVFVQLKQIQIIHGLVSGLRFLHSNKIIHRDLKPGNVMFTKEYQLPIKIGDFGQCRMVPGHEDHTFTKSGIGTRQYTAPEVLDRRGKYSYQSDLFSLGLIIWVVVLKNTQVQSLFNRLVYDESAELVKDDHPLIGKIAKQLVTSLTKKKVEERCQNMGDVEKIISNWESVQITEKELHCRNGEDLMLCLPFVSPGSTILLESIVHQGQFTLMTDNVRIVGKGVRHKVAKQF
ncbi:interferon-induced, double-stranded RNA-activated protein kinase [Folsomia candida]|uniref:interferon-induced, double-stranded RNA-activated protein kinase n=1 Tax=Folsomia candida TaxID=158441 RepID=UPI001604A74B|nr:interferon-induced, double-stranded RNA-activated protein kinase [Folsomia candida]